MANLAGMETFFDPCADAIFRTLSDKSSFARGWLKKQTHQYAAEAITELIYSAGVSMTLPTVTSIDFDPVSSRRQQEE